MATKKVFIKGKLVTAPITSKTQYAQLPVKPVTKPSPFTTSSSSSSSSSSSVSTTNPKKPAAIKSSSSKTGGSPPQDEFFPDTLTTYLGNKGYTLLKAELTQSQIEWLEKTLTVKPAIAGNPSFVASVMNQVTFPIYRESSKKYYIPRYFGEKHMGVPKTLEITGGDDIDIEFQGTLRDNQVPVVETYLNHVAQTPDTGGGGLLNLPCAFGKCFAKDTPILMYDGSIKMVQDIVVGEQVMGDDNTPRNVLSLGTGREKMYKISDISEMANVSQPTHVECKEVSETNGQIDGTTANPATEYVGNISDYQYEHNYEYDSYTVNKSHILSLKYIKRLNKDTPAGTIIDIKVSDYIKLPAAHKSKLHGYRAPLLRFPHKDTQIDPYIMGLIVSGILFNPNILNDPTRYFNSQQCKIKVYPIERIFVLIDIKKYISTEIKNISQEYTITSNDYNSITITSPKCSNIYSEYIQRIINTDSPYILSDYMYNSIDSRLKFIAGIIDSGYSETLMVGFTPEARNGIRFKTDTDSTCLKTQTDYKKYHNLIKYLLEDIRYIARSIGLYSTIYKSDDTTCTPDQLVIKCSPYTTFRTLPTIRYKVLTRKINVIKTNRYMEYPINVVEQADDDYYGFELDGNRRFILGNFTVTHNTSISLYLISKLKKKALVIVHKEFLLNQWVERIQQFLPTARVGRIQGPLVDIENKDICIAMLQSLSMKDYPADTFASFGTMVVDEVHHISSEVFSRSLFKIVTKYTLGLSATMDRKDGTTYVFKQFLGDIVYKGIRDEEHNVLVRAIEYKTNDTEFNQTEYDFRGTPQFSKMIVKLCDYSPRSDFIVRVIADLIAENPDKQIMILAHNRSILTYLYDSITNKQIATAGYYVGGMKQAELQASETKQVVIATFSMAAEALDIKTLSTLVMVTSKTDIEQSVGRILRMRHSTPIVVDIVDSHDIFQNQWRLRQRYYKKCNYRIFKTTSEQYTNMCINWEQPAGWKTVFAPKSISKVESVSDDEDAANGNSRHGVGIGKCTIDISGFDM
jgi:superfamily II DNA or RNA helicase